MTKVQDVRLHIEPFPGGDARWSVHVTWTLAFEAWERAAWFQEVVEIFGLVDGEEQLLASLTGPAFTPGDATTPDDRSTPIVVMDAERLDIDPPDVYRLGPVRIAIPHRDDIAARVAIAPLVTEGAVARSPIVSGLFEVVEP